MTRAIAQTPAEAYVAVNPDEALPSGDPRYVALDTVRGTRNIAELLRDLLTVRESGVGVGTSRDYARFLITGHSGCGKTTELYRLQDLLVQAGFGVVYFDAGIEFDLQNQNVGWWSILLEMLWQVDEQLSRVPYNLHIPDDLRDRAVEWLARVVTKKTERAEMEAALTTEFEASAGLSFFAKIKAALKASLKTGSSTLKEIQQEAERRPTVLHNAVSDLITYVQEGLCERERRSLVIIADGLEKIPLRSLGGPSEGLTTHNAVFIHSGQHLKAPPCHLVYALPLALLSSANIGQVFPEQPMLIPMVRVRHHDGQEERRALRVMEEVVIRRVARSVCAPGVIKMLALASGGHIRDFLRLIHEAASGFGERITKADARRAVIGMVDLYNRTIQQELIAPLDYVAQHGELPGGPHDGELVNRLLVLEYRNDETWTALHPCIKDAPRYVRAPRAHPEETGI
jgi:hypothetical protein